MKRSKSKIIDAMMETARDLGLSPITIKEIDSLNLQEINILDAEEIRKMRAIRNGSEGKLNQRGRI